MLPRKFNLRVTNAEMASKCVRTTKRLFLCAQIAPDLLFAAVMYGIFMPSQIVRAREDSVARLPRARIYAFAAVRTSLGVQKTLRRVGVDPSCAR
jgi:hypothetical protein